jgi:hypothetical protein
VFAGGSYGTYLEWLLTTLTTDCPIVEPLRLDSGSSHNFRGNHLINMAGWNKYTTNTEQHFQFVRLHPKTEKKESITASLETILSSVDRVIYLYPDSDSILLNINNYYTKIWKNWWTWMFNNEINPDKIYNNWSIDPTTPMDQIPIWIKREFLSYYLLPSWFDQVEWFHPAKWNHNRCYTLLITDLLDNIEQVLEEIKTSTNLTFVKPIKSILPLHKKMLNLQQHRGQDLLCYKIINSIVNDIEFSWDDQLLPLPSQSYIQWRLRELGYEIKCHDLNLFPTNSIHLKSILYQSDKNC